MANSKNQQITINNYTKIKENEQNPTSETVEIRKIQLNAEFESFLDLRDAIEKYQRENSVQLIVKDSKLLKAESTRKIMPKVYHLVNQSLMYHSIMYCCKCHGELKQKPHTRIKKFGYKRLNCPMYIRFKLSQDLRKLVLFDMNETHNHGIDTNTIQMTPRQQVYRISRLKRRRTPNEPEDIGLDDEAHRDNEHQPFTKNVPAEKISKHSPSKAGGEKDLKIEVAEKADAKVVLNKEDNNQIFSDSPLDSDSSCSDSDEEEIREHQHLLPFPVRLIGSAITCSPELLMCTKQLIDIQKSKLLLEKQKLILETKHLELANTKLELEVKMLEKTLAADLPSSTNKKDTTIFLQTN